MITRRNFLKTSLIFAGCCALGGCSDTKPEDLANYILYYDKMYSDTYFKTYPEANFKGDIEQCVSKYVYKLSSVYDTSTHETSVRKDRIRLQFYVIASAAQMETVVAKINEKFDEQCTYEIESAYQGDSYDAGNHYYLIEFTYEDQDGNSAYVMPLHDFSNKLLHIKSISGENTITIVAEVIATQSQITNMKEYYLNNLNTEIDVKEVGSNYIDKRFGIIENGKN